MDFIESLKETKFLSEDGYKLVNQGYIQEPLVGENEMCTIEPYSGEYGTGYIVRSVFSAGAQYHHYEIYVKEGGDCVD